jgi:hypothetical protein
VIRLAIGKVYAWDDVKHDAWYIIPNLAGCEALLFFYRHRH